MFDKDQLNAIFNLADTFRTCVRKERPIDHILKGKVLANIFYEVGFLPGIPEKVSSASFSALVLSNNVFRINFFLNDLFKMKEITMNVISFICLSEGNRDK